MEITEFKEGDPPGIILKKWVDHEIETGELMSREEMAVIAVVIMSRLIFRALGIANYEELEEAVKAQYKE